MICAVCCNAESLGANMAVKVCERDLARVFWKDSDLITATSDAAPGAVFRFGFLNTSCAAWYISLKVYGCALMLRVG